MLNQFSRLWLASKSNGLVAWTVADLSLISEIEIILDGQRVQINTGGYFSATNTLNKLFCPTAVRKAALSHNHVLNSDLDTKSFYNWYMHNQFQELEMKAYLKNPSFEYTKSLHPNFGKKKNSDRMHVSKSHKNTTHAPPKKEC